MNMEMLLDVLLAVLGGAIRVGTPFLFVSLGECITEKSGRINLGLEGVLVFSAMAGFAGSLWSGSAWVGVFIAATAGAALGSLHGLLCSLPRVNDIAVGIGLMLFGTGLAFYFGKPLIQPQAAQLISISLGAFSESPKVVQALSINPLFPIGVFLALVLNWAFKNTRWGLNLRMVGDSSQAALAIGASVTRERILATSYGGLIAGIGGASLSLYYPGSWNEGLSSGQGLIAVALVIYARWNPLNCLLAALVFGGAGAIGPALQSVGVSKGYNLFNAIPYALTLLILILTCEPNRTIKGSPSELSVAR